MSMVNKNMGLSNDNEKLGALFCVAGEMKAENGEDSYYYASCGNKVIVSVFDGCGGIGSRRYVNFSGKTGAFVASRAVCGGIKNWFECEGADSRTIKPAIERVLKICDSFADGGGRLMGSLGKSFPTTAAITVAETSRNGVSLSCLWSGDSRCYMLNEKGLHQLSRDDIEGDDAFLNLSDDGVLKNVITSNFPFVVNEKKLQIGYPCVILAATDGCFGYVNTPMEFEYLLLKTLEDATNIEEWKLHLNRRILDFAGDDYTMCVATFGFNDFDHLKQYFYERASFIKTNYIDSGKDAEAKWDLYKSEYYSL